MARKAAEAGEDSGGDGAAATPRAAPLTVGAPLTAGALLRQAREAAGLSLEDVSTRTKVRRGILKEIEADDHHALPALTYTLGFVKAFARTVGIDPQLAADRYRTESRKGEPVPTLVDLEPLEARRLPSRGLVMLLSTIVILVLGLVAAWGLGWFSPATPSEPKLAQMPAAQTQAEAEAGSADAAPAAPVIPADAPVKLTAADEVWLRVSDERAKETLFMGTLAKGQSLDLPPGRPWQLHTGRAGALEVRVGGQLLPPLGGPAEQVRDSLLTPDALLGRTPATALANTPGANTPGVGAPVPGAAKAPAAKAPPAAPVPGLADARVPAPAPVQPAASPAGQ